MMTRMRYSAAFLVAVALAFTGSLALRAQQAPTQQAQTPAEPEPLKPGPGAEQANVQCLLCHSADYISTQPRLSRAAWNAAVFKMKDKYGAPINTNTVPQLVDYLTKAYGPDPSR